MDHVPFENHAILISMNIPKFIFFLLFVCLVIGTVSCAHQTKPTVTLSPTRVFHSGHVEMRGTGFTKDTNIYSHLRRPDGTEFPVLPMRTNDRGEFVHDIDTLLLAPGVHEVWVEEEQSKQTSDIVHFEVTSEQK